MESAYIVGKYYEQINFSEVPLPKGDYEQCTFTNCNFSNTDLSHISFVDCTFSACNMSMARLNNTAFKDVHFKDGKLLGLHFEHCNTFLFKVSFDSCLINLASFYNLKLKKTLFKNSSLQEVDFSNADLSEAVFDQCDLAYAVFDNTIVEKVDFRTSFHYAIDPERNRIKKAKFSLPGVTGLLNKYNIDIE